ncbi:hypothetical protein MAUB_30050 [Mycolicibacterium aubagnense]|uniref:Transposase n=1 Tax=Mycolicibacterium aubagnense TaxID=319707 RepID=A0ABM7IES3_9MYCO|nr:hypothetical protein C1S80_27300 [Mycolicibacterium aubagnense]BBX85132.1 hypothetical protein MAUB_30050 [Mycolicibacterium aubagnense]
MVAAEHRRTQKPVGVFAAVAFGMRIDHFENLTSYLIQLLIAHIRLACRDWRLVGDNGLADDAPVPTSRSGLPAHRGRVLRP